MGDKNTKLSLSRTDLSVFLNRTFFEQKRELTGRFITLLHQIEALYRQTIQPFNGKIPSEVFPARAKISKGENYLGLPYLILDFPAVFQKEDIFAFRTMIWWANPFTVTLHLSGKYVQLFPAEPDFSDGLIREDEFFICINSDPWQHHLETSNYILYSEFRKIKGQVRSLGEKNKFLKFAIRIPADQPEMLYEKGPDFLRFMLLQITKL